MKKLLILLFFILLSYNVLAESQKSIFSGTLRAGESGVADGKNFTAFISGVKVLVDYDHKTFIIKESGCDSQYNIKVCVDSVEADDQATISILKKTANIIVTKKIPKYSYKNQILTINIEIKNLDSDIPARNLIFTENISDDFIFIGSSGCNLENNLLKLKADLYKNEVVVCTYDIIPKKAGKFRLFSNIKFYDNDNLEEINKDNSLNVKEYGINIIVEKLPKENFDLNEDINFRFNLSNDFPDEVIIKNMEARPKLFDIKNSKLSITGDVSRWSGNIYGNSSKQFYIEGNILGYANEIEFYIEYSTLGRSGISKDYIIFNVTRSDPEIRFNNYNKVFKSADRLILYFRNSGSKQIYGYKDIKMNIRSNILSSEINKNIPLLNYGDEYKIGLDKKEMSDGRYPIFIKTDYKTLNDESMHFERTEFIMINNSKSEIQQIPEVVNNISDSKTPEDTKQLINKYIYTIPVIILIFIFFKFRRFFSNKL